MLRRSSSPLVHQILRIKSRAFSSQNVSISDSGIRKTVDLDPSYDALMNDVEMSLLKHRKNDSKSQPSAAFTGKVIKEAEYYPVVPSPSSSLVDSEELQEYFVSEDSEHLHEHEKRERKSPAAAFGSKQIGSVILPDELQEAISKVIVRTSFFLSKSPINEMDDRIR